MVKCFWTSYFEATRSTTENVKSSIPNSGLRKVLSKRGKKEQNPLSYEGTFSSLTVKLLLVDGAGFGSLCCNNGPRHLMTRGVLMKFDMI